MGSSRTTRWLGAVAAVITPMKRGAERKVRRLAVLSAGAVLMATVPVVAQVAAAPPAAAVPGLQWVFAQSAADSVSPKMLIARCPAGKRVVGGGGGVFDAPTDQINQVMLTALEPLHDTVNGDGFMAVGYERGAGISVTWTIAAYALCADPIAGLEIVTTTTNPSSSTFKATTAVCPGTKKVVSTGARVSDAGGRVGLQLNRSDGAIGISRATAREDAGGYAGAWSLTSYAVCANPIGAITPPPGTVVSGQAFGSFSCPNDSAGRPTFVHAAMGGGSLTDVDGPIFLRSLVPGSNLKSMSIQMTGVLPNGMAVGEICAP
jgi:hypothetical protein